MRWHRGLFFQFAKFFVLQYIKKCDPNTQKAGEENPLKREDFVFSIGYAGDTAIVDKGARAKYGSFSTEQLLQAGLYRSAFCSALYSESTEEQQLVLDKVNSDCGTSLTDIGQLKRLYGVFSVPQEVGKVKVL